MPPALRSISWEKIVPSTALRSKWLDEQHNSQNDYLFAIRRNADDLLLGYVNLDGLLWSHRNLLRS